jgi:PilZ domain
MSEPTAPGTQRQGQSVIPERRASARHLSNLQTACQLVGAASSEMWDATVRDLSSGGIGLVLKRRFEPGTLLSFILDSRTHSGTHSYLARVVHATANEGGGWLLGCRLLGEIGEEELQAFGASRVKPAESDARAWVRFACQVATTCQRVGCGPPQSWPATIVDISPGGMKLLCCVVVGPNTLVSVALPGDPPRSVLVRVLHVRGAGDGWQLGCAFADTLGPDELASLE